MENLTREQLIQLLLAQSGAGVSYAPPGTSGYTPFNVAEVATSPNTAPLPRAYQLPIPDFSYDQFGSGGAGNMGTIDVDRLKTMGRGLLNAITPYNLYINPTTKIPENPNIRLPNDVFGIKRNGIGI